jgi:transposase-like protein
MLTGEVEADETFVGGLARNMHKDKKARKITGTGGKDKIIVIGILERGGKVRTKVVDNRRKKALRAEIREHVEVGSALYTDALKSYHGRVNLNIRSWIMPSNTCAGRFTPMEWRISGAL